MQEKTRSSVFHELYTKVGRGTRLRVGDVQYSARECDNAYYQRWYTHPEENLANGDSEILTTYPLMQLDFFLVRICETGMWMIRSS